MKPSIIIGLVIAVVLAAGGIVWMRNQAPVPPVDEADSFDEFEAGAGPDFVQLAPSSAPELTVTPAVATSPAVGSAEAGGTVITFNDTGATPSAVTVVAGTAVRFVNNGQVPRWPASDVHPTHEILPEFDVKRGLQTGEAYAFTFVKVGTWPWHDHLHPTVRGTITVTAQ